MSGIRVLCVSITILLASVPSGSVTAQNPSTQKSSEPLRVLNVSYGEFVPVEQLELRREALIRRAFEEGRAKVQLYYPDGSIREVSPTEEDLARALAEHADSPPPSAASETDFDGDGFEGADDGPPFLFGEHIADIPRITVDFGALVEAGVFREIVETEEIEEFSRELQKSTRVTTFNVSNTKEFKETFKFGLGNLFQKALDAAKFKFSADMQLTAGVEATRSSRWERSVANETRRETEEHRTLKRQRVVSTEKDAGFVRSQLLFTNLSHFPADMEVSNIRVQAVAYSPRTSAKLAFDETTIDGPLFLYAGTGNNDASIFVEMDGLNTEHVEKALLQGFMFDFDVSGGYQARSLDGTIDWRARRSNALTKTAWIRVNYGDETNVATRQVAIQARGGGDLTVQKALIEIFGSDNVEFGVHPDGSTIVTRINHRQNRHADRDFDDLTLEERAEYGRWVVGYKFSDANLATELLLDSTRLVQGDIVGVYYLTKDDLVPPPPVPDSIHTFDLPGDGRIEEGGALVVDEPVRVGDVIEIDVENRFTVLEQTSRHHRAVATWNCGLMVNATCFGWDIEFDDTVQADIPRLDWYKFKVSFNATRPRTWLLPSQLGATVVARRDFPAYRFTLRFTVTEVLLQGRPQGTIRVAQDRSNQTILRDCRGYDVAGHSIDCTSRIPKEYRASSGEVRWFKYTPDVDQDTFLATYHFGDDWHDYDATIYPGAPELWDGKDNDQDTRTESVSISGDSSIRPNVSTRYTAQVNWWDGGVPVFVWHRRDQFSDGRLGSWKYLGNGTSVTTSLDEGLQGFELQLRARVDGRTLSERLMVRMREPYPCEIDPRIICPDADPRLRKRLP